MVVAHPDDEIFWGGATLAAGSRWGVVCLTHSRTSRRRRSFLRATEALGAVPLIFNVPDRRDQKVTNGDIQLMRDLLSPLVTRSSVKSVLTHSPDGETGHPFHKCVSAVVTSLVTIEKLHYFSFDPERNIEVQDPELWSHKKTALALYFPEPESVQGNDALHISLSRFEAPVPASSYQTPRDILRSVYGGSTVPNGSI